MHELNILLKIEFRRAFKNKLFAASIVIGLALAAGAFIQTVVPHIDVLGGYDGSVASYPHSVFTSWMGIGIGYDIWATVYLYVCIICETYVHIYVYIYCAILYIWRSILCNCPCFVIYI